MKCPNCGFENPPDMRFCGMCGTRLTRVCPSCRFVNPPNYRFCGMCGTRLDGAVQDAAPQGAAPQGGVAKDATAQGAAASVPDGKTIRTQEPQQALGREIQSLNRGMPRHAGPSRETTASLEGERRVATIILADVRSSTDLMEQLGTEPWVTLMNRVFQILEAEIYTYGGVVDQFRGDGLVAFFGTTMAHEDDPERAIHAALAMQRAIAPYAEELAANEGIDLRLRVGVNTGEVIVASVGDRERYSEDTAMGGAIAIAARMETAAEPGTVLVSEYTYRLTASQFEWQSLGQIRVKGISHPIAVYRPLGRAPDVERPSYALSVPMIGRKVEFETLKSCVEALFKERGGIVMLSGERGIGKSLLLTEVRQHLVRREALLAEAASERAMQPMNLTWLLGYCRSYGKAWPYSMWRDLLEDWLGVSQEESKEKVRERLYEHAVMLWGDRISEYYPYLATFMDLPLEPAFAERVKYLDAEGLRQQFFRTIQDWIVALSKQKPLVLCFFKTHWADPSSLDLLKYCLPLADTASLLWIIVFRPDRTAPIWQFRYHVETEYPHRLTSLTVPPLTDAQSVEFIHRLVGRHALPAETQTVLIAKAEGNPYYIRELIHALMAEGTLVQDAEGKWTMTRTVTSLDLPDSLQSLLLARIDRLPPEARQVLQMAAVIGTTFWSHPLQYLARDTSMNAHQLHAYLTTLQREQLVHEHGRRQELGMAYTFTSTLICDVAYDSLLTAQRFSYHLGVAEYFEVNFEQEALKPYSGTLAYHYHRANKPEKELFYVLQAAAQARTLYANAEAIDHYTRSLDILVSLEAEATDEERRSMILPQRFEVLKNRREVLFLVGDFEAGRADSRALLPLARELKDQPALLCDALLRQPEVAAWKTKAELRAGIPMTEEALTIARRLGDQRREMYCLGSMAGQKYALREDDWLETGEQAIQLARKLGEQRFEVGLLTALGSVYAMTDPERSIEYFEMALPISEALNDKQLELDLIDLMGVQLESSSDYTKRLKEGYEKQLAISREIGNRPAEARALMFCGQLRGIYLGDYETALAMLEESLHIWERMYNKTFPLLRIAQIRTEQGRYEQALELLDRARENHDAESKGFGEAGLCLVSALLYNAMGDVAHLQQVLTLTQQIKDIFDDNPELSLQYEMVAACEAAAAHLGLARLLDEEDQRATHLQLALESSRQAVELYDSFGFVRPVECTSEKILFRYSKVLAANDHQSEAERYLKRAHEEMMRKYAMIPPDSPFRRTYLENIMLHQEIRSAYDLNSVQIKWDGSRISLQFME